MSPIAETTNAQPSVRRVPCTIPGCGKRFYRKEHLTRHLKSHDPQRQYACHVCGRRYARSDVLKRHVEHHSRDVEPTRTLVACVSCHERKLKCDNNTPCQSCTRISSDCRRLNSAQEGRTVPMERGNDDINGIVNGNGNDDEIIDANDQMFANSDEDMAAIGAALPTSDLQQSATWLQPAQEHWPLPYPTTGFDAAYTNNPGVGGLDGPWVADSSIFTPANILFMIPANNQPQAHDLESHPRSNMDLHVSTTPLVAEQSPASSRPSITDQSVDLHTDLDRGSLATSKLIQLFFSEIHPHWPILHAPTFKIENASDVLLGSMILLASWLQGESYRKRLGPSVFDTLTTDLLGHSLSSSEDTQPAPLQTLQALLLCVVYTTRCLVSADKRFKKALLTERKTTEGMLAEAIHLNDILILKCRRLGVFNGQYADHDDEDHLFDFWLAQEQLHRLAFSVLRIDAYLSLLVDHPPSVRYQEISIPLPKSVRLWTAASEDERRRLQWSEPAGREKARFCLIIRDALGEGRRQQLPFHLTEIDYHLGLCSFQAGIWETAREAHSCESDELFTDSRPRDHVREWRIRIDLWRTSMENDCHIRQEYFSGTTSSADHMCAPLQLILWHVSALILHAPVKLLQGQGCCFKCRPSTAGNSKKNKTRLRGWIKTSCARIAVWNAAQIARVVAQECARSGTTPSNRLRLNPLAIPGLLKSAIVVCSYAFLTSACPNCTGGPPIDLVYLFDAPEDDERLVKWKECGEGLADWGPLSAPICGCRVRQLARWFLRPLAMDRNAEAEFRAFLGTLGIKDL